MYDADDLLAFSRCHESGDLFSLQHANGDFHGDTLHTECIKIKLSGDLKQFRWLDNCSF